MARISCWWISSPTIAASSGAREDCCFKRLLLEEKLSAKQTDEVESLPSKYNLTPHPTSLCSATFPSRGRRLPHMLGLFLPKTQDTVPPKNIGKIQKKSKKTLAKRAYFLYNNSARKFSVVIYTTHPGTCRSRDLTIGRPE